MKLFAIVTAGLMAAGGGVYMYSTSTCSKSACSAPVAKTGGCCAKQATAESDCCLKQEECCLTAEPCCADAAAKQAKVKACCEAQEECCLTAEACCAVATGAKKAKACCEAQEKCCVTVEACCAVATGASGQVKAKVEGCLAPAPAPVATAPIVIKSCCEESRSATLQTVISAATSVVNVK